MEQFQDLVLVAQRVLSASELQSFVALSEEKWAARFFDLWTLKEAYGKARGLGLILPLKAISLEIGSADSVRVSFAREIADDPSKWLFWLHHLPPVYTLSVAIRRVVGESLEIVERVVRFDETAKDCECPQLSILSASTIPIS